MSSAGQRAQHRMRRHRRASRRAWRRRRRPRRCAARRGGLLRDHAFEQLAVEHADAARLDHDVGLARLGEHAAQALDRRRIDHRARPLGRLDVAVLLAVEGVGLVEGDVVAMRRQRLEDAAIIGRGAVPVGRQQARSVEGDFHAASLAGGWREVAAREAGDDREQLVDPVRAAMPRADRLEPVAHELARAAPDRRAGRARWRAISAPSRATGNPGPAGTGPRRRPTAR